MLKIEFVNNLPENDKVKRHIFGNHVAGEFKNTLISAIFLKTCEFDFKQICSYHTVYNKQKSSSSVWVDPNNGFLFMQCPIDIYLVMQNPTNPL